MVKLTFCLHRLPDLTRESFQRYWRETHAPLVAKHADAMGMLRYVQVHSRPETLDANQALRASRGAPSSYDGIAELWWESEDAIAASMTTKPGLEAAQILLEDERKFIDLERSPLWLSDEHTIIDRAG